MVILQYNGFLTEKTPTFMGLFGRLCSHLADDLQDILPLYLNKNRDNPIPCITIHTGI